MVMISKKISKIIFGFSTATLYLIFGVLQVIVSLGIGLDFTRALYIPVDIIGAFILILIGLIFFYGIKELISGINEGVAYIYIGIFVALIFLIIYLLIIAANAVEAHIILNEEFEDWKLLDDMRPGIYLGILPLMGFGIWHKKFRLSKR